MCISSCTVYANTTLVKSVSGKYKWIWNWIFMKVYFKHHFNMTRKSPDNITGQKDNEARILYYLINDFAFALIEACVQISCMLLLKLFSLRLANL